MVRPPPVPNSQLLIWLVKTPYWVNSVSFTSGSGLCNHDHLYNWLVVQSDWTATTLNCGKPLRAFTTSCYRETYINTQGNDLGHSNNVKDWAIRIQAPKSDIARIWRRFRDYNGLGMRNLASSYESLRYSPSLIEM